MFPGDTINQLPCVRTVRASKRNVVLHFDYLFVGEMAEGSKYSHVLKDDSSSYSWLSPTAYQNSEHAESTLTRPYRVFTVPAY